MDQQTYNLPEENVKQYLKHHEASTIIHKHNNRDALKEHPDVQKFLEWKKMHKVCQVAVCACSILL